MSATHSKKANRQNQKAKKLKKEAPRQDVLFQKIFDKWYAFSVVDGECLMAEVSPDELNHFQTKAADK